MLPEPGVIYPIGFLTRLEAHHGRDNEMEWRYPADKNRAPTAYWSVKRNALYIPLRKPTVIKTGRGTPQGTEKEAKEFELWTWQDQTKWDYVDLGELPPMTPVGGMIAIEYYSNKHDGTWKKHIHRPAGDKDIVSVGPTIDRVNWIYIKGPRMRATTLGLKY